MSWRACLLVVLLAAVPLRGAIAADPSHARERPNCVASTAPEAGQDCRSPDADGRAQASTHDDLCADMAVASHAPLPTPETREQARPDYLAPASSAVPGRALERPPRHSALV